jgi:hypothetical protein
MRGSPVTVPNPPARVAREERASRAGSVCAEADADVAEEALTETPEVVQHFEAVDMILLCHALARGSDRPDAGASPDSDPSAGGIARRPDRSVIRPELEVS